MVDEIVYMANECQLSGLNRVSISGSCRILFPSLSKSDEVSLHRTMEWWAPCVMHSGVYPGKTPKN